MPDGHAHKPNLLTNLGMSLESRFKRLGDLADLDKAIEYQARAVQLAPQNHPQKATHLNNLGNSLESRFKRLNDLADLDKAIDYKSQAVQLTSDSHPHKPGLLNNRGNSLQSRFDRLGSLADLEQAIDSKSQAVLQTPDNHPHKPDFLNSLGISWNSRFRELGNLADLDKAIDYQLQAVQLMPDGHTRQPDLLNLDKAIIHQIQAVRLMPEGHPRRPSYCQRLGSSLWARFLRLQKSTDLESACASFKDGTKTPATDPYVQLVCAQKWATCSVWLNISPLQAYQAAFTLLPYLVWLGQPIHERYRILAEIGNIAAEAAAWAVSVKFYNLALEWLEEGRSIVWSQILRLRTPFDDLSVVDHELAEQLRDTASQLEAAGLRIEVTESPAPSELALELQAQRHHMLAVQWEQLLTEARKLPGFQDYLLPRKSQELKKAATNGPVVAINIHPSRCDALIVFPHREDVVH
ncbi:hypothetical protein FRC07_001537, partial [Ceratobasidium sp. 392]